MDQSEEFDAERLRARIHDNVKKRRSALDGPRPAAHPVAPDGLDQADLALLRSSADVANVPFASHRMVLAYLAVLAKTLVSKLLTTVLSRQNTYNAANLRLIEMSRRELAQTESEIHLRRST